MDEKLTMVVSREHICNGDDEQTRRTLEYSKDEMLSQFLKNKVAGYLPSAMGKTIWCIYINSDMDMGAEREDPGKKVAFIHKNEHSCVKCEIKGGDRQVVSLGTDSMYCAIYR